MKKTSKLQLLISQFKLLRDNFFNTFAISDIISNSKIFEIIIANTLDHTLLPKLSGSRDAVDSRGFEYEYKHYKETSSNHSWTFNDYSNTTINKLKSIPAVIFAHIDDTKIPPVFDWYYEVPGPAISQYLYEKTKPIKNKRKMINVSPKQIESFMHIHKTYTHALQHRGQYNDWIIQILSVANEIENLIGTKNILTSNKFWELLIADKLNHTVLSEQKAFDAVDDAGNYYEYKVSQSCSWAFEDISDRVLEKFDKLKGVYLAKVDKKSFSIQTLLYGQPAKVKEKLISKLRQKIIKYKENGKEIRRLQVSLTKKEILQLNGEIII
jgi:hypothetical protein